jgi:CHAT domain-containing protein
VPFQALAEGGSTMLQRWTLTIAPALAGGPVPAPAAPLSAPWLTPSCATPGAVLVLAVPDARAPAVEAEAAAIAAQFPTATVLLAQEATSAALAGALPGPAVLHIACHGLHRASNPLFSSLRLADRWLTCADVLDLDLGGALVTLSACESGRHGHTVEPVGLAWAFLAAGASGVIVSRWVVHDDTTSTLMAELYRHLAGGLRPAQALRAAQLTLAQTHPHPFHWAPFSYVAWPARTDRGIR